MARGRYPADRTQALTQIAAAVIGSAAAAQLGSAHERYLADAAKLGVTSEQAEADFRQALEALLRVVEANPVKCERTAICSTCGSALSCQGCGGKHSTCSDASCEIHRPCSCGEADCHWNGAGEVIHALGWHDTPKPELSRPAGMGERLSKPWVQ